MATQNVIDDKHNVEMVEQTHRDDSIPETNREDGFQRYLDPILDKQTLRRLDLLLVPLVCSMYLLAFLDRANIGNARVAGLQTNLGMTDIQYQTGELVPFHSWMKTCIFLN